MCVHPFYRLPLQAPQKLISHLYLEHTANHVRPPGAVASAGVGGVLGRRVPDGGGVPHRLRDGECERELEGERRCCAATASLHSFTHLTLARSLAYSWIHSHTHTRARDGDFFSLSLSLFIPQTCTMSWRSFLPT